MKKSNRNFYEREEVTELPDELKYQQGYNPIGVNLFNLETFRNLQLQSLDYSFYNELNRNEDSFKAIFSKPRMKKPIKNAFRVFIGALVLFLIVKLVGNDVEVLFRTFGVALSDETIKVLNDLLALVKDKSTVAFSAVSGVCFAVAMLSFLGTKKFFSFTGSARSAIILDGMGFYKVDFDLTGVQENELHELYFVKYIEQILDYPLTDKITSVSYFSTYSTSYKSRKSYVLDLPNDSMSFSNSYDLEFYKGDYSKKDYKELVQYLNDTEDSGEEE